MKLITTIHPGTIVGEMAVVDGEKRFATCIAAEPSVLAVLTRDALVQIIDNEPKLGGKLVGYLKVD